MHLAYPHSLHDDRYLSVVLSMIKELFPLDAAPVFSHLLRVKFPTGPLYRYVFNRFEQMKGEEGPGPVKDRAKEGVVWWVGMMFRHKRLGYVGLVLGWEEARKYDGERLRFLGLDRLPKELEQPYYKVITDSGQLMGKFPPNLTIELILIHCLQM